jgi:OOP family OmpA-OmpF porin
MANAQTSQVESDSVEKDEAMAKQSKVILAQQISQAATENENTALKRNESDEKMVIDAAAQFTKDEAEVYRQDGVLIIRLKSMSFASGRSDLPSDSMKVLSKVKGIILQLGSEAIVVQGHTDSQGQAKRNQVLSEKRAESVMKYFASGEEMESKKLSSTGFGFSKPLATNKTQAGRSENRRVDVLITTNHTH